VIAVLSLFTGSGIAIPRVPVAPREGSDQEEIELLDEDMEVDFVKGDAVILAIWFASRFIFRCPCSPSVKRVAVGCVPCAGPT